jgi:hypothetical protein
VWLGQSLGDQASAKVEVGAARLIGELAQRHEPGQTADINLSIHRSDRIAPRPRRHLSRFIIGVEPAGRAHDAMLPVPVLIGTALTVSAQALGKPSIQQMNAYFEWLTDAGAK